MGRVEIKREIRKAFEKEYGVLPKSRELKGLVVVNSLTGCKAMFYLGEHEYSFVNGHLRKHS